MILGHVATLLIPLRDIVVLNMLGAIMTGAGGGVMTLLFARLLMRFSLDSSEGKTSSNWMPICAAFGGLLTSLTPVWWAQGTLFEAYALHALLLPIVMVTFLNYLETDEDEQKGTIWKISRAGFLFSFALGLSFTNHGTTIILAPAFLYLFFSQFGFTGGTLRRLIRLVPGFVLGLLPYLYLPIRAAADPLINWGRPTTFSRFFDHITGGQFRDLGLMSEVSVVGDQLGWYFATLPGEFVYIGLLLALYGVFMLFKRSVQLGIFTGLLFVFCLLFSGTYAIKEIEPYFMTATLTVGIWAAIGLWGVMRRFGKSLAITIGGLTILFSGFLHYSQVDQSDNRMVEDLALNVLAPLPDNAVLFTTRWDIFLAGTMYMQYAEGVRPNVSVINVEMLHDRIYLSQVIDANAEFRRVTKRIRAFVNQRKRVDQGDQMTKKDSLEYERLFYKMLNGIITTNDRPTFVTSEIDPLVGIGWNRVPVNLTTAIIPDTGYIPVREVDYRFSLPERRAVPDVLSAAEFYAIAELERAEYELQFGKKEIAEKYAKRALRYDPEVDPNNVPILPMGNKRYVRDKAKFFQSLR